MNRSFIYFTIALCSAVALIFIGLPYSAIGLLGVRDLTGYFTLIVLALVAEGVSIRYVIGGQQIASSIAFIPLFAVSTIFPVGAAIPAATGVLLAGEFAFRRRAPSKALFNTAQAILSLYLASSTFHSIRIPGDTASEMWGFALMAAIFFTANLIFVSIGMALERRQRLGSVLNTLTESGSSDLIYDLLVSPIAILVYFIYQDVWITGILIVVLPLLIIRHSYFSKLKLQHANTALLKVLVKAIETRDPYTSGHSVRVSRISKAIGSDLGLRRLQLDELETAALLHDIGKVDGVYADLIKKPSSLTPDEVQVIRTHATRGADFLHTLSIFSEETILGIRHHHERYDGSGYPGGLVAAKIPLIARIIQISDSIDAMLSDRPYRKALRLDQVYKELKRCAGTQFDPEIVDAMMRHDTLRSIAISQGYEHENSAQLQPA